MRKLALERKDEDMIRAKAERRLKKKQDKEEAAMKIKLEVSEEKERSRFGAVCAVCRPPPLTPIFLFSLHPHNRT